MKQTACPARYSATNLVRDGTDVVIIAVLLGHARLETSRGDTRPTTQDQVGALDLLAGEALGRR